MQKMLESLDAVTLLDDQQGNIWILFVKVLVLYMFLAPSRTLKEGFNTNDLYTLEAKAKRKSVATRLNKVMDKNDSNMEKIRELLAKG